jgi:hypothetical protein
MAAILPSPLLRHETALPPDLEEFFIFFLYLVSQGSYGVSTY